MCLGVENYCVGLPHKLGSTSSPSVNRSDSLLIESRTECETVTVYDVYCDRVASGVSAGQPGLGLCVLYKLAALAAASVAVRRMARRRKVRHAQVNVASRSC